MTQKKILITSALPYANGPLHFGHIAGAYLPGDVYSRFERLQGNDVLYVCGSDEYGVAISLSAEVAKRSPQEHVDHYHEVLKGFFQQLNFGFDHYSRTTCKGHKEPAYQYFRDLLANGYIEKRVCDQLYSESDNRFLADRYVVGTCPSCGFENARGDECQKCGASYEATDLKEPRSKLTNSPLTRRATTHWFLLLDQFQERLLAWLETKNWKPNVTNFVRKYIEDLHPRAITRDSDWGLPVPLDDAEGKVLYVWFDAPIGYISASQEWAELQGEPDKWRDYWCDEQTKLVQFIGKDNIPFHAAIFPAMTMGQNEPYKVVDELPANEFYNLEGRKFSKSDGWYIDLDVFFSRYTADQIRWTIASNAPETSDSEFTWKDFQMRCNSELVGKLGNFANRTLVFIQKQCEGQVPQMSPKADDQAFLDEIKRLVGEIEKSFSTFRLRQATRQIMDLATLGNTYFDTKAPWKAAKDPERRGEMETTLRCCLECVKALAVVTAPIIPESSSKLLHLLGREPAASWDEATTLDLAGELPKPAVLFQKVEDEQIEEEIAKLHKMAAV